MDKDEFFNEIICELKTNNTDKKQMSLLKRDLCKKYGIKELPTDIEILLRAKKEDLPLLKKFLITKPTRTLSGVSPVAIMTEPSSCPHGKCTMCPGGPNSFFGNVPQSYTGHEPATMRGIRAHFESYVQVFSRLEQYMLLGQVPDKVDLIIMGGTFPATDHKYQEEFVTYAFKAMNDFSESFFINGEFDVLSFKEFFELPRKIEDKELSQKIQEKILAKKKEGTLAEEHKRNEEAKIRCIGLTIETKPDWAFLQHGNDMLRLGCTRVELGVQSVYDEALTIVHRGHTTEDNIKSIRELKDLGFKLNYHMMLGLPTVTNREKDIFGMREIFENSDYRPDMIKIYPCMVMPGTALFAQHKAGLFTPITTLEAAERIAEIKQFIPTYCRIMRVQRDIPTKVTTAGVDKTNLRQYVDKFLTEKKILCRCIRCREAGRKLGSTTSELVIKEYAASKGIEYFISEEDVAQDIIFCFVRMRFPSQQLRPEITSESALIRELHVYGTAVGIGDVEEAKIQHKGLGKKLMAKAEEIAKNNGKKKMIVISGVGVRGYYRKLGYVQEGPYMVKEL